MKAVISDTNTRIDIYDCWNNYALEAAITDITQDLPTESNISFLMITDKQYERIISYHNNRPQSHENPDQLTLF